MELTNEIVKQLKSEHGNDLHKVSIGDHVFVVRAPSREAYRRFREATGGALSRAEDLLADCVVWPERDDREKLIDSKPGLIDTLSGELVELAGALEKVFREKL